VSIAPRGSENRPRLRRRLPLVAVFSALFSCQSYTPEPLQVDAHRERWLAHSVDPEAVEASASTTSLADRLAAPSRLDLTDGITLAEARLLALALNPELRLERAAASRAGVLAAHAGLLADPQLAAQVQHIAESVPDPWVVGLGVEFELPLTDERDARVARATAGVAVAERTLLEAEWRVWSEAELLWIEWVRLSERERHIREQAEVLSAFASSIAGLVDAGELDRVEAGLFELEAARLSLEGEEARSTRDSREWELRALMGLHAEAEVQLVPGALPLTALPSVDLAALPDTSPELMRLRAEFDAAEAALRLAVAQQVPNPSLGPLLEVDEGQTRFGIGGVLALPIWNANRAAIAAARVDRELARTRYEVAFERLALELQAAHDRAAREQQLAERTHDELQPLAADQMRRATELLQLGESNPIALFESLSLALRVELLATDRRATAATSRAHYLALAGPSATPPAQQP